MDSPLQMLDDIPEAQRQPVEAPTPSPWINPRVWRGGAVGLAALTIGVGIFFVVRNAQLARPGSETTATTPTAATTERNSPALLGHLPYKEAPQNQLEPIVAGGHIQLRRAAAQAYRNMVTAAQADGIPLMPLSGFRTVEDQTHLFFEVKAERSQSATQRAKVSAPPQP